MLRDKSAKPPLRRLSELQAGQIADFFVLLVERKPGATRDGRPYYACRFRDLRRTAAFMAWADAECFERCDKEWRPGMFFKVRATYSEHHQYGPQIDIHNIRAVNDADRADGFSEDDFLEQPRRDAEQMFAELRGVVTAGIADEPLRRLVLTLLDRHPERFKKMGATRRHYYAFPGGLLEHTLSVAKKCLWLAEQYGADYPSLEPPLNKDVVVASAVLHEIGRVVEYEPAADPAQPAELTVPGRLFGHLLLGRDLVRDGAREQGDVSPPLLQLLEHVLVSHLNLGEPGSFRQALIPEALILHHADDLDAEMELFVRCLRKDAGAGAFTERDPVLGRQLLKGRDV
jgi:3'-5' exoribonuclease